MLSLTDGKNQTTSWKYDEYGRMTNKTDAAGAVSDVARGMMSTYSGCWLVNVPGTAPVACGH